MASRRAGPSPPEAHRHAIMSAAVHQWQPRRATMLAIWVKVKIKAAMRDKFLKAIEADALGSERDEPGCLRFNVRQDEKDENVYYFYEVYKDQAVLEGPTEPTRCKPVFPAARQYWGKM